jgi:phosphoribosylaminoimidazole-succinocarboxamide synthase
LRVGTDLTAVDLGDLPGLGDHRSGKVRESWSLSGGRRILVTTDRLSAFDRVVGTVAHKGQVLNELSAWWFDRTADVVANHLLAVPDPNVSVVVQARPLPVEVVVRARLTGSTSTSLLPRYEAGERDLYGHTLPDGLARHGPLPAPLVTPTTKAGAGGHDEPITAEAVVERALVPSGLWERVQAVALALFDRGAEVAAEAGFVLADTKYEFGLGPEGDLLLIDEVHTPDSSRFWAADTLAERLAAGAEPESYDKEPVRLALRAAGYRGDGPPPRLNAEVWAEASRRYVTLFERLTGQPFVPAARPAAERTRSAVAGFSS